MLIVFNPSGTHIRGGFLKIRLDLYPDPGDKTYWGQHILVPVFPKEGYPGEVNEIGEPLQPDHYDSWVASLPKEWRTNPCLCHFITVDAEITPRELRIIVSYIFDDWTIQKLDDALVQFDSLSRVKRLMIDKTGKGEPVGKVDIRRINKRLELISGY